MLNLAGLVVPVFGQLMMGVAVGEMLGEMFEAVEDWSHGEQSQALEHVLNVVENIAGMVLFAAGVKTVSQVIKATKIAPAAFFDKVEAIRHPGDTPRLWRRRLGAYRQLWEIDAHAIANSQGIYQANGQSYIKVDGALYSITYDARLGHWRARHALRNTAYRPPLRHNGQGGWQFTFERADQWFDERHLLVRLDPGLLSIPEDQLRGIASITGLTLPVFEPWPEKACRCRNAFATVWCVCGKTRRCVTWRGSLNTSPGRMPIRPLRSCGLCRCWRAGPKADFSRCWTTMAICSNAIRTRRLLTTRT
ncbi:hypothetical protein [Pseudomonas trivialis]|uniref:hypothetical protein n=1 Tax=Pseudomonas trivialis TaxID=200450 RepID=UPI0030CB5D3B